MKEQAEQKAREISRLRLRSDLTFADIESAITTALIEAEQRGRKAMEKWCRHLRTCNMRKMPNRGRPLPRVCTCGLGEARTVDGKGGE